LECWLDANWRASWPRGDDSPNSALAGFTLSERRQPLPICRGENGISPPVIVLCSKKGANLSLPSLRKSGEMSPFISIQPDLQLLVQPGGNTAGRTQ
jgi:hypothetical protein